MPPQNRHLLVATLILASATGGCSFAFVNGPPANHRQLSFFGCTSGNTIPTLDLAVGALTAVDAVVAGTGGGGSTSTGSNKGDAITFAAMAAVLGASAAYGYKKTSECRDAEADLVRRTPPTPVLAPQLYRPPVPYDPWVPHPAPAPAAPAPAAPAPVVSPPGSPPAAPSPKPSSPWDPASPTQ